MTDKEKLKKAKLALLSMQRHSWEQGVTMQAFLEQGDLDVVVALANEAAYRCLPDGRLAVLGSSTAATDPCSVGEALRVSAETTGEPRLKNAYEKLLHWALKEAPANNEGIVYHFVNRKEFWVDSMYMLPPFLADAGYYDEAIRQINGYWEKLCHPLAHMLSHKWDDETQTYRREERWGVGNGWALAGITRVISKLPDSYAETKTQLQKKVKDLLDEILKFMEPDGMFHDVIDRPDTFKEVNLSQMAAYTIFRGMKSGWLPDSYLQKAELLRAAANRQADEYGLIWNVCGAPSFDRAGIAPEGQAFYLLMEAAAVDFYRQKTLHERG